MSDRRLPPTWHVELSAHKLDRWNIRTRTLIAPAVSAKQAREFIVEAAHQAAGVPPMRSLQRRSLPYARVIA